MLFSRSLYETNLFIYLLTLRNNNNNDNNNDDDDDDDKRVGLELLTNFGHRIALVSSDDKKGQLLLFLFQRLSIDLQRFNAIVAA